MIRQKRQSHSPEELDISSSSDSDSGESSSESNTRKVKTNLILTKKHQKASKKLELENRHSSFGSKSTSKKETNMLKKISHKRFKGQFKPNNVEMKETHIPNSKSYKDKLSFRIPKDSNDLSENSHSDNDSSSGEESDSESHKTQKFNVRKPQQNSGQSPSSQTGFVSERFMLDDHSDESSDNGTDTSDGGDSDTSGNYDHNKASAGEKALNKASTCKSASDNSDESGDSDTSDDQDNDDSRTVTVESEADQNSGESSDNNNGASDDDDDDDEKAGAGESHAGTEQDEYSAIRKELADIPFEDLLKIKEKVGIKVFNKILHGNVEDKSKQKTFKRDSRHKAAVKEIDLDLKEYHFIVVIEAVARDPRFDDLSGEFRDYHFAKNYSFLDDMKIKEREVVKKEMKKTSNDEKKRELKGLLNRLEQEQQVKEMKKKKQNLEKMYVEKEREMVKEGKTPYFLKKSDKKTLELAMQFKELKQEGRLDSYMSKKRKKVAQKQRKKMPSQQSGVI